MTPPHTLVVTNDYPPRPGGIQAFVQGLVMRQPADSITVYAPAWKGADAYDRAQDYEVVRHPTSLMLPDPMVIRRAKQLVRSTGATRVIFGAAAPLGLIADSLRRVGVERTVAITHGHEAGWASLPGARQALRSIGQQNDIVTYLGEYTRSRIASALTPQAAQRMRRLVPGVDDESFSPDNREQGESIRVRYGLADRPVIVCVSRLMPRKGQDTLIRALPIIQQRVPDAALLIVGGGPYRKKLAQLVDSLGLGGDVVLTGSVEWEELPAHYAAGDVFAMPCRTRNRGLDVEGLGIVYLEASATGLPVVAGDSGGAPDAVLDGVTGRVVQGDNIDQTATVLADLLLDPQLRTTMGRAGRQWIESQWRWQFISDRLTLMLSGHDPDQDPARSTDHP